MAVGKSSSSPGDKKKSSPVHFFSHGSTMMLGEDSASARYWEQAGQEALRQGVEHVVIMVCLLSPFPFLSLIILRMYHHDMT